MLKLKAFVKLMRPQQWYKNFLIFLGIIFSANIFEIDLYLPLILGFIGLCTISSVNYIINDWRDIQLDKIHPEKKTRPLASGLVSKKEAAILVIALLFIVILTITFMPITNGNRSQYFLLLMIIFTTSQSYSLYFKDQPFYDVTFIALNYIWRAVVGVVIISVTLSPWLFILGFLFALFLALSKRKGDLFLLGEEDAKLHKPVFKIYSHTLLDQL
ncbi:MAG: UbiA prenyltransferase family protein, partial [Candidatus Hodarchaeales archaeon]